MAASEYIYYILEHTSGLFRNITSDYIIMDPFGHLQIHNIVQHHAYKCFVHIETWKHTARVFCLRPAVCMVKVWNMPTTKSACQALQPGCHWTKLESKGRALTFPENTKGTFISLLSLQVLSCPWHPPYSTIRLAVCKSKKIHNKERT